MPRRLLLLSLLACALPLGAQAVVDPGMTRAAVVARLGTPLLTRTAGDASYLFYRNGCERRCGMHDVVVLSGDAVVDAIFRSAKRRYSGQSSSPRAIPPAEAQRAKATRREATDSALVLPITIKAIKKDPVP